MKRRYWVGFGVILSLIGFSIYFQSTDSTNVEVMSDAGSNSERIAFIGLLTGITGLLTAIVNLVKELLSAKSKPND